MTRLRALIVDDEPLARDGIELYLARHRDFEVVGSIGRAAEAVSAIRRLSPDVLFLDVQMPGMTGFDVLERVGVDTVPVVIFVTAHDAHAIDAFRAHALDYLLKPVDAERFDDAVARARERLTDLRYRETGRRLRALLDDVAVRPAGDSPPEPFLDRIAVKDRDRIGFVPVADIDWIEAHGDYVRLHAGARPRLTRESLSALERRLDPRRFVRIHRSAIVNLARVSELRPYFHGEYVVVLSTGARLKASRTHSASLMRALGGEP